MENADSFLTTLDSKLFKAEEGNYAGRPCLWPITNDEPISEEEVNNVLGLLNQQDYAMCPTNVNMGFREAFSIYRMDAVVVGEPLEAERLLTFSYKQMPESITWEMMSEHYMQNRNLELLRLAGFNEPSPSIAKYMY
tara:strand:+ start:13389 stop:13799 length:411 start_codon:yes stop_codon:yes gene_type:complete